MAFTTHYSVLEGIKQKDDGAWNRFHKLYAPLIVLHGQDCGVPKDMIDDLVQEVLLAIVKNNERFTYDSSKGHFRNYLRRIIRNKANNILRERYRSSHLPLPEDKEFEAEDSELDSRFEREWQEYMGRVALEQLRSTISAEHYQVFEMHNVHNCSPREIAEFLDVPLQTVYSTLKRTGEKLKKLVDQIAN